MYRTYLAPKDQLNLLLVEYGLKPSSLLLFDVNSIDSSSLGVWLNQLEVYSHIQNNEDKSKINCYVGHTKENLEKLVNATSDFEYGIAYGYPNHLVNLYQEGKIRAKSFQKSLSDAEKSGFTIPEWIAYISFIPYPHNILEENICSHSKELGQGYQQFVQRTDPQLANQVEDDFRDKCVKISKIF